MKFKPLLLVVVNLAPASILIHANPANAGDCFSCNILGGDFYSGPILPPDISQSLDTLVQQGDYREATILLESSLEGTRDEDNQNLIQMAIEELQQLEVEQLQQLAIPEGQLRPDSFRLTIPGTLQRDSILQENLELEQGISY